MKRKQIKGFERYEITDDGRVWSTISDIWRSTHLDKDGYVRVGLCGLYGKKNFGVHRLVAEAFIPNPDNLPEVNHINGNRADNRVENLEWVSFMDNQKKVMKAPKRVKHPPIGKYDMDWNLLDTFSTYADAARSIEGNQTHQTRLNHIRDCCLNNKPESQQYLGFNWKFVLQN